MRGLELVDEQLRRLVPVHQPPFARRLDLPARVAGGVDLERPGSALLAKRRDDVRQGLVTPGAKVLFGSVEIGL